MKIFVNTITIILILTGRIVASDAVSSLDDLIDKALQNNIDIQISQQELNGAKATEKGAYAGFLPSINFSLSKSLNTEDTLRYYQGSTFSISQTLFDGAQSWYSNRSVANNIHRSEVNLRSRIENVVLEVKTAYYQYLSSLELVEVAEYSLELANSQLKLVQQQYDLQAVSETDLMKAKVRRGQAEAQVLRRMQQVQSAMNDVCLVLGETADCNLNIKRVSVNPGVLPEPEQARVTLSQNNTQLKLADINIRNAELAYQTQVGIFLPTVTVGMSYSGPGYDVADQFDGLMKTHPTSSLNVSLPIFAGMSKKAGLDQLKYELRTVQSSRHSLSLQLIAQLDNILSQLETYHLLIPINEEIINSADQDVKLVEKKYHLGSSDILDVLTAQNSLIQAKSDLVQIKHEAKIYEAQLEVLLGP